MKVFLLKPKSTFSTKLRSDTLWGLIMNAIKNVFSEEVLIGLLNLYDDGMAPFKISSCFPYRNNNGVIEYYFPKPIYYSSQKTVNLEKQKNIKKIEYITKSDFENFLALNITDFTESAPKIKQEIVQKNAIDRLTNSTGGDDDKGKLFYLNEYYFENKYNSDEIVTYHNEKVGLYFIADGDLKYLIPALNYLQHYGFGGNHSRGKCYFDVEIVEEDLKIIEPDDANCYITLSYYLPTKDEILEFKKQESLLMYELETRAGYLAYENMNQYHQKDAVVGFKEGSILPIIRKNHYGYNPIVFGDNVRHYGYALKVKAKIDTGEL